MIDAYRILTEPATARITRLRSRFIARLCPVETVKDVSATLARTEREHHDASHVCYAYRLMTQEGPITHSTDAGEPAGSAGGPILQALEAAQLYSVLAVVVRYFGGKKLGFGGLIRAYSDATARALAQAHIGVHHRTVRVAVRFPPEIGSAVMSLIQRHPARVEAVSYKSDARVTLALPPSDLDRFAAELVEASGARAQLEELR